MEIKENGGHKLFDLILHPSVIKVIILSSLDGAVNLMKTGGQYFIMPRSDGRSRPHNSSLLGSMDSRCI